MPEAIDRLFSREIKAAREEFGDHNVYHNSEVDEAPEGAFVIARQGVDALDYVRENDQLEVVGGGDLPEYGDVLTVKIVGGGS